MWDTNTKREILDLLDEGLKGIKNPEICRAYFDAMAVFYNFSWQNSMLIFKQLPSAMEVRTYDEWNAADRTIRRGQKAISILLYRSDQNHERGEYVVKKVFDYSQTSSRTSDSYSRKEFWTAEQIFSALKAQYYIQERDMGEVKIPALFDPHTKELSINENLTTKEKIQQLIPAISEWRTEDVSIATSVSYIVLSHFGLAGTVEKETFDIFSEMSALSQKQTLGRIKTFSERLITGIEQELRNQSREKIAEFTGFAHDATSVAESWMQRCEELGSKFSKEEKSCIREHARMLYNAQSTKRLISQLVSAFSIEKRKQVLAAAQEEIDSLPDQSISVKQLHEFGYTKNGVLPLNKKMAQELLEENVPVLRLKPNNVGKKCRNILDVKKHDGLFGIYYKEWERYHTAKLTALIQKEDPAVYCIHVDDNRFHDEYVHIFPTEKGYDFIRYRNDLSIRSEGCASDFSFSIETVKEYLIRDFFGLPNARSERMEQESFMETLKLTEKTGWPPVLHKYLLTDKPYIPDLEDGPIVTIISSAHPSISSGVRAPLKIANDLLNRLDSIERDTGEIYDTHFDIRMKQNNFHDVYEGTIHIGSGEGGLLQHVEYFIKRHPGVTEIRKMKDFFFYASGVG